MSNEIKVDKIAKVCHQANKALCEINGDNSQPSWEDAPEWQRSSARDGVRNALKNPHITPEDLHIGWMEMKIDEGWSYGAVKNPAKKQHPCMLP